MFYVNPGIFFLTLTLQNLDYLKIFETALGDCIKHDMELTDRFRVLYVKPSVTSKEKPA